MFVGVFIYADDVTLLAPTSMALKAMLSICTAASHHLIFNASKTKCMYFSDAGSQLQNTVKYISCDVKTKLLDSYCLGLDVYGSQLWNYSKHDVDMFYCMAEIYSTTLKNTTHCNLLLSIN